MTGPTRRKWLSTFATGTAAGLSSVAVPLLATANSPEQPAGDEWTQEFNNALEQKPWLLGYQSASANEFDSDARLSGKWPDNLRGTLYRNGPARHQIGGFRYQHWFDGDGMMHAWSINRDQRSSQVRHRSRLVQTRKLTAETKAGRALYPGFGTLPPNPAAVTSPDLVNVANISVLPHHGKLFALWEAGSPWEMDPESLATKGIQVFSEDTQGVPFSAHPRVEPDGTLWNFGYLSAANLIVLWHINAQGEVVKASTVKVDPMTMPHDFVVTKNHLVMLLPPLHYRPGQGNTFLDAHEWAPQDPTRVMVVDKNDFSNVQWLELPAQWVFHFGNAWEDDQGVIRFDAAHSENPEIMLSSFRDVMRGITPRSQDSLHYRYQIDTKASKITQAPMFGMGFQSEFPVIDPRVSTRYNRFLTFLSADIAAPAPHGSLTSVSRFDAKSDTVQSYRYPAQKIPEEHLYVPEPGKGPEQGGWILGTALDYATAQTELNLFQAEHLSDGPIATATLPYALPLGLHGKFVASDNPLYG